MKFLVNNPSSRLIFSRKLLGTPDFFNCPVFSWVVWKFPMSRKVQIPLNFWDILFFPGNMFFRDSTVPPNFSDDPFLPDKMFLGLAEFGERIGYGRLAGDPHLSALCETLEYGCLAVGYHQGWLPTVHT